MKNLLASMFTVSLVVGIQASVDAIASHYVPSSEQPWPIRCGDFEQVWCLRVPPEEAYPSICSLSEVICLRSQPWQTQVEEDSIEMWPQSCTEPHVWCIRIPPGHGYPLRCERLDTVCIRASCQKRLENAAEWGIPLSADSPCLADQSLPGV